MIEFEMFLILEKSVMIFTTFSNVTFSIIYANNISQEDI